MFRFRIACRQLSASLGRFTTTVIAIAAGVAMTTSILLVNSTLVTSFEESFDALAGHANLQVVAPNSGAFSESVLEQANATPGVKIAVPVVTATAFTDDDSGELLAVYGVDMLSDAAVRMYEVRDDDGVVIEEPLVFLSQPDSVIVTTELLRRRHLAVGDGLRLVTPNGVRSFIVRGVLEPTGVARSYGGSLVVMDVFAAQRAFTQVGQLTQVDIVAADDGDVDAIARALRRRLPSQLRVERPMRRKLAVRGLVEGFQLLVDCFSALGLLAGFLITFNRLSTVFLQRLSEVGVMRALGLRQRVVARELVKEGLLLGLIGVAIGLPLGVALAHFLAPALANVMALNFNLPLHPTGMAVQARPLLAAGALGLATAASAAFLPAARAARMPVVEVLRAGSLVWSRAPARFSTRSLTGAAGLTVIGLLVMFSGHAHGLVGLGVTLSILVTACLLLLPLLLVVAGPLTRLLSATFGIGGRLAAAELVRVPGRTALMLGMITIGISTVVWFSTLGRSFEISVKRATAQATQSDLIVSSHFVRGQNEAPTHEELIARLRTVPGVDRASGERLASIGSGSEEIRVWALDSVHFRDPRLAKWVLTGAQIPDALERVADGDAVLASPNLAAARRVSVGGQLTLQTPSGPLTTTLAGLSVGFLSPNGHVVMSRELYRRRWRDPLITRAHVFVQPGTPRQAAREEIARRLGRQYRLRILSAAELLEFVAQQVRQGFLVTTIVSVITLVVVMLGTLDTLAAGIVDRTPELAAMRALGIHRRRLAEMVAIQSVTTGVIGVLLAVVIGLALAWLWVHSILPSILGWTLEFHVSYWALGGALLFSVVGCLIAAIVPARWAMHLSPAQGLRAG